jgi:hypothetical protein
MITKIKFEIYFNLIYCFIKAFLHRYVSVISRIILTIVEFILYCISIVIYIAFLLLQCPDAVEGVLSPFQDNYLDLKELDVVLSLDLDVDIYDDIELYPSEIDLFEIESFNYDPFETVCNVFVDSNIAAFEQNKGLSYDILSVNGTLVAVGAENSIFTIDLLQTIKDISLDSIEKIDSSGNKITILTIDKKITDLLAEELSPISSLFSGLTEARILGDAQYEQEILNIRIEQVLFSSEGSSSIPSISNEDIISIINVNPVADQTFNQNSEEFTIELAHRQQMKMN